ncbi:MAG: hypothetical protein ACR2MZ_06340 [Candidatus Dormibacter sp.]|uniref:hypothetical protein n=1 Tax=Candidatus Dormibacter sp. TaxID=2973982 RepID=UPI003D9ACF50
MAAPVHDQSGIFLAALSVAGPRQRLKDRGSRSWWPRPTPWRRAFPRTSAAKRSPRQR